MSLTITIRPTATLSMINGTPARLWEGRTLGGCRVLLWTARLAVHPGEDDSELYRELLILDEGREDISIEEIIERDRIARLKAPAAN